MDIAHRILVKCEEAKNDGIGDEIGADSHCDGDTSHEQSWTFGVSDKRPPLQHVVSVTGCGVTFNIEITGLTYVSVNIVEPYITISKENALNWLDLLGYKQENIIQIDNETRELMKNSDDNCTSVSVDVQNIKSDNIEVTNPHQELAHGLHELHKNNAEPDDVRRTDIDEVTSFVKNIISKRKSSEDIESDNYLLKKIKLEIEDSEEIASDSLIISESDEPIVKYENYVCDMPADGERMDSPLSDGSRMETSENGCEDQDKVATAKTHENDEEDIEENEASPSRSNRQGQGLDDAEDKCTCTSTFYWKCDFCRRHAPNMKRFEYEHCTYETHSSVLFERHAKKMHPANLTMKCFKCEICPYQTCSSGLLEKHTKNQHTTNRNIKCFKCEICSYQTGYPGLFERHTKKHVAGTALTCDDCGYFAYKRRQIEQHIRMYTKHKPYNCTLCDFTTACQLGLKKHSKTHTTKNIFKCTHPDCGYTSSISNSMMVHERTHTGVHPFKCTLCPFTATQSSGLNRHIRTHTLERPHKCTMCPYASSEAGHLRRHISRHTNDKQYKCSLCSYSVTDSRCLKQHYLKKHNR